MNASAAMCLTCNLHEARLASKVPDDANVCNAIPGHDTQFRTTRLNGALKELRLASTDGNQVTCPGLSRKRPRRVQSTRSVP